MLTRVGMALAERGLIPDAVVTAGIDRLLRARLQQLHQQREPTPVSRVVQAMAGLPIATATATANAQHYEVPAPFFQHVLGRRLKYSCAYWPAGVETLDAAEEAMLALTVQRAGIADGMRILDLGCGWGSLTLWLAEHFPHCHIVALSNSSSQRFHIEEMCRIRGWRHVEVLTCDINRFATDQRFDRIVTIEMLEHVRNYPRVLAQLASWLTPAGQLFVHIFCHRQYAYFFEDRDEGDWMARQFFTGGLMPSEDLLSRFPRDLRIARRWRVNGTHYARTADAWLANLDRRAPAVRAILGAAHGQPDASIAWHRWRLFFLACRELFAFSDGEEWFVAHYLLDRA